MANKQLPTAKAEERVLRHAQMYSMCNSTYRNILSSPMKIIQLAFATCVFFVYIFASGCLGRRHLRVPVGAQLRPAGLPRTRPLRTLRPAAKLGGARPAPPHSHARGRLCSETEGVLRPVFNRISAIFSHAVSPSCSLIFTPLRNVFVTRCEKDIICSLDIQ